MKAKVIALNSATRLWYSFSRGFSRVPNNFKLANFAVNIQFKIVKGRIMKQKDIAITNPAKKLSKIIVGFNSDPRTKKTKAVAIKFKSSQKPKSFCLTIALTFSPLT